jgi:hypothetical protein
MSDDTITRGNRLRPFIWGGAALLLSLPAIAMTFFQDAGVNWTALDFAVMGTMLLVACGAYELGTRISGDWNYRAGFGAAVLAGFLMTWSNLAVGIIGDGPVNLVFFGVLAIAMGGALVTRFTAIGMQRTMGLTGVATLACAALGVVLDSPLVGFLTSIFAAMWFASAWLFSRAARQQATARA